MVARGADFSSARATGFLSADRCGQLKATDAVPPSSPSIVSPVSALYFLGPVVAARFGTVLSARCAAPRASRLLSASIVGLLGLRHRLFVSQNGNRSWHHDLAPADDRTAEAAPARDVARDRVQGPR
jgi:hypothetical protein